MNHRRLEEDMALASEQRRFEAVQLGAMEAEEAEMREASRYCPLKHDSLHAVLPCCVVAADHCDHCAHTAAPAALFICVPFVYVCVCVWSSPYVHGTNAHDRVRAAYGVPHPHPVGMGMGMGMGMPPPMPPPVVGFVFFFSFFFLFFCAIKCVVLVFHFSIRK